MLTQYSIENQPLKYQPFIYDILPYCRNLLLPHIANTSLISMNALEKTKLSTAYSLQNSFQIKCQIEEGKLSIEPNMLEIAQYGSSDDNKYDEKILGLIRNYKTYQSEPKIAYSFLNHKRNHQQIEPTIRYKYKTACINAVKREVHLSYFV